MKLTVDVYESVTGRIKLGKVGSDCGVNGYRITMKHLGTTELDIAETQAPSATVDEKTTAINWLREFLWANHGCHFSHLYGDDGEMSCGICKADFKRYPISELIELYEMKKMEKAKAVTETNLLKAISQQPTVDVDLVESICNFVNENYAYIADERGSKMPLELFLQEALRGTYSREEMRKYAIDFLDSIRDYERENGQRICFDERESSELLDQYDTERGK